jgi:hypothetical protein
MLNLLLHLIKCDSINRSLTVTVEV